ncbi:MAG: hypothetical protein IT161_10275, partial [Bryobacterales bacterium]|nr:hypothetical protein [Bryobacterales bacterium]
MYARRWESPDGRTGYSPNTERNWKAYYAAKPEDRKRVDKETRKNIQLDDQAIHDHLSGKHTIGIYPLLLDETCWFLAVDFDKKDWKEDASAFRETCSTLGVPASVECSRSGNGAHIWIFFERPVAAGLARRLGSLLLTRTMERRHQLGLDSYDRLFPNQDTMPTGGFGNLIALPLQHGSREQGNSVFVDERFVPYADQWAFLASVPRIDPSAAETIARDATGTGRVVGIRFAEVVDEEEAVAPWTRLPSGRTPAKCITGALPSVVNGVLAQRLFLEKAELPSPMINQLKRIAAFQNPEFYRKQKMRLSTALTPRVIACAEDLERFVALPRGCASAAEQLLAEHGVRLAIEDQRHQGSAVTYMFDGELTPIQKEAA